MILNLTSFLENTPGSLFAYKKPTGKNHSLAEHIINTCQQQGRLYSNKFSIASSGRFAVEIAKICKMLGIDFLPILGKFEDPLSFKQINDMGFNIDRTPSEEKAQRIHELKQEGWYYFDQFTDPIMVNYYHNEAQLALNEFGKKPDAFIDFMGSGATMRGFYETLKNTCELYFSNSCYRDERKYEKKPFIKDLINSQEIKIIDVHGSLAGHLYFRYQNGEFEQFGYAARSFFTSVQGAINWLQENPNKTVLLYWED